MELRGMFTGEDDAGAWWRTQRPVPEGGWSVTADEPLTVLMAGGARGTGRCGGVLRQGHEGGAV